MTQRPRRGVTFWIGLGLVAAGLALLGYVGWQFLGTNIVSERKQRQAVEALQQQWREEPQASLGEAQRVDHARPGDATALIRIPRFGDDYVMPLFEGVGEDVLARGFGHFEGSAPAGGKGNFAIAAHRVTHGQPLRRMPELRPGDTVVVEGRDAVYTYVLDTDPNDLIVTFRDVWVIDPKPDNPDPNGVGPADAPRLITLTTCSEIFHTDNRMIAFGHLVSKAMKPSA